MATVGLLGRGASCLSSSTVDLIDGSGIADLEFLLADEGWHCLRVELETRCGVVGGAEAIKLQSIRVAAVRAGLRATEGLAGVEFGLAPLTSSS